MNDKCDFNNLPPLLTKEEEKQLGQYLATGTDEQKELAKYRFVESNIRLVIKMAKDYCNLGVELEDLINEGNMGLMVASDRYDPNRGTKFSTYASFWIRQKILRALTNKSSLIRLPVYLKQQYFNIRKYVDEYRGVHNEAPTNEQIAKKFGIAVKKVEKIFEITAPIYRLDAEAGEDVGLSWAEFVEDENIPTPSIVLQEKEEYDNLVEMLSNLSEREEYILRHRFGLSNEQEKETLEKIGEKFGVTRERIRQVEEAALRKLKFMYHNKKKLTSL